MRKIGLVVLAIIAGVALLCLQLAHRGASPDEVTPGSVAQRADPSGAIKPRPAASQLQSAVSVDEPVAPDALTAAPRSVPAAPQAGEPIAATAESSSLPPETVLANMRTAIRQYASAYGENPVGTNPEITSTLQGENPKHLNFLRPDGNRVNAKGELVDVWGTPYFFHQISGHEMEIRSAGPDRVMYTADDLVTR